MVTRTLVAPGNKACIVGPRGIGKSETAKECAYRIHDLYPEIIIIWIQGCDQLAVQATYDRIFREKTEPQYVDHQEMTLQNLVEKLDTGFDGRWVLIIDDIASRANGQPVLRRLASTPIINGSILFTMCNRYDAAILVNDNFIFTLDPMTVEEATQLLGLELEGVFLPDEGINDLVQHLEFVPSAIIKAAGFMRMYNLSTVQYLEYLRRQEDHVSNLHLQNNLGLPGTCALIGTDMLSAVSMKTLYEKDGDTGQLLAIMACLGNTRIPLTLFDASYWPRDLTRSLIVLRDSFLISVSDSDDTITVPRLVRLSVRAFVRRHQASARFAALALQLISEKFPETGKQHAMLRECRLLLPHALTILQEYASQWTTCDAKHRQAQTGVTPSQQLSPWDFLAPLALRVSHFLRIVGQYANAFQLAGQAIQWLFNGYNIHASAAEAFLCESNIATISHYLGRPIIFACRVEQLFRSQTVLLNSHKPLTIRALRSKGLALQAQGHHGQAEGYHRRAIAICNSIYGPRHVKLLDENHGLALSFLGQGRAQEALCTLYEIYTAMEASLGLSNPKTLSVLANIGCALQHLSRWTEAYEVMTRALSGRKAVLGEDHPHTIQSRANLAQIYVANEDMAGAEKITRETLRIHVAKLGEDHHLSLHILNNLGYLLLGQEIYSEAAETLHTVATKREIVLGAQHCDTLASMFYASEAYWKMSRFDEALYLGRKVLEGRRSLSHGEPSLGEIENRLAEIEGDRWLGLERCKA
ncbi:hypothetical protein DPSP01_008546 [Paraphaeosphaeria sporulosa]